MPKVKSKELPDGLRPYAFHGIDIQYTPGDDNALAECPFCGRMKFAIEPETSKFQCFVCEEKGNSVLFLRKFWELCETDTTTNDYRELAAQSGFTKYESPKRFGVVKSTLTGEWLVPGYNAERNMTGLYRYAHFPSEKAYRLLPTPTMGHHLFNLHNYEDHKPIVDLCEGWRDAIAWEEALMLDSSSGVPFLDDRNVLAVPGVNSFKPQWCQFLAGKVVNILFDNDHPRKHPKTGKQVESAAVTGIKQVASKLASARTPPAQINHIAWNGSEYHYSLSLPTGMDLRDYLRTEGK